MYTKKSMEWPSSVKVCYINLQSVCKTGRVVIAHEAPLTAGFAGEISSTIQVSEQDSVYSVVLCGEHGSFPLWHDPIVSVADSMLEQSWPQPYTLSHYPLNCCCVVENQTWPH